MAALLAYLLVAHPVTEKVDLLFFFVPHFCTLNTLQMPYYVIRWTLHLVL